MDSTVFFTVFAGVLTCVAGQLISKLAVVAFGAVPLPCEYRLIPARV